MAFGQSTLIALLDVLYRDHSACLSVFLRLYQKDSFALYALCRRYLHYHAFVRP